MRGKSNKMPNYLHGIETIELAKGPVPVTVVKSAVIALVGIAPNEYGKNEVKLVQSDTDAANYGKEVPGFNIPKSLKHIFAQGYGTVLVVNTFSLTSNTAQVTDEVVVIANGKGKTAYAPLTAPTIKESDNDAVTWVAGTDYTIDAYGNFQALTTNVANGSYKFSYKKLDASTVESSQLIGTVDSETDARTGMKCFALSQNLFGFKPKIFIAPGYSSIAAIATEMIAQATTFKGVALLDAAYGKTVTGAIADRGVPGSTNFSTSSDRAFLLYPYLKAYDEATNTNQDAPYSAFMAGLIAATDNADGYHHSPSNRNINGIVGVERNITAGVNDATSEANLLNEAGITTVFNSFGTGIRSWGNRTAAYPTVTALNNFLSVRRTADVIHESIENACLQFIDRPITKALVDAVRETANNFVRVLIGRGALVPGSRVEFPANLNTPTTIAAGKLNYNLIMCPPPPLERITLQSYIDISLLANLTAAN